ncbi:MAG: efflux RND transporter periplasmic adaptor subunit [Pseudohongiella sp.]|uniref:efflux RND transporter periplasmic adaptor subunit n=1 Tax=Pseudohongiella sp. TaxID=1979412 RepID=UPI0034A0A612
MKSKFWHHSQRWLLPLLIVAIGSAITTAMIMLRPEPPSTPTAERVVPVQTLTVTSADMNINVSSQGTVQPRTQTSIVAEVSGRVMSVSDKLVSGGFFSAGDVMLTIDPADYEVAVDQARANLLTAQAQLAQEQAQADQAAREWDLSGRPRENAPILALRTPFLREAEARVLYSESELRRAQRQLDRTTVRAPYDALVREKSADIGQYLGTGAQIAEIFATDYAEIRLPLNDADMRWLTLPAPGQLAPANATRVTLHTNVAGKKHHWQAEIVRTEGVVDSTSRMHYAVARVNDPYGMQDMTEAPPLPAGSFVNADIEGNRVPGVFDIPLEALRNGNQVLVMDAEQRLRQRQVNVIRSDADRVYVNEGLNNNDQVIISPVPIPIEGMRVNPDAGQS